MSAKSMVKPDDGYYRYGNSSGRGKGVSIICFENITSGASFTMLTRISDISFGNFLL
jgi:hypothetical protein